ncbi:hypothetical protein KAU11_09195 [Candidatus Babeliales bacterium]|nr:hypothetical protein [Candidatus Babeliales bacterium]
MYLNTARIAWEALRAAVTSDDTAITSFNYGDWPTSNTFLLSKPTFNDANGVVIAFHGTDAANEDFAYKIYGRTRANGPIQLLLGGIATLGAQACIQDPIDKATVITNGKWVDTITIPDGIFTGIAEVLDSTNDRIAMLKFDTTHIEDLYVEIDLDGGSTTAAAAYAIITGY